MATKSELLKKIEGLKTSITDLHKEKESYKDKLEECKEVLTQEQERQKWEIPKHLNSLRYERAIDDLFQNIEQIYIEDLEQFIKDQTL